MAPVQAQTATETVLHNFQGPPHGENPVAGVIRDSAGNLYGTTQYGGTAGAGVVYKLDTAGHATVLHTFTGADGANPYAGLIRDSAGNFYGSTINGGAVGAGAVFKLDRAGHETVLYSFTGGADGSDADAGVIRDSTGNLYGTAQYGGTAGAGVVFKVDTTGAETVLYSFTGGADGANPRGGVIRDSAGNLYGTTYGGGTSGAGVVFKLDTSGHQTVLYTFTGGTDGGYPVAGVIRDSAGNLYGTATGGGTAGAGAVYKLNTTGQETVLYSFPGGAGGAGPQAGLTRDSAGNLYGTTAHGGTAGAGVVYELNAAGQASVLYSFTGGADGNRPLGAVTRDSAGNLYATTNKGGTGLGVVFELNASGQETVLYSFTGGADGVNPLSGVTRDSAGNLYGTTYLGGTSNAGMVYKLTAAGAETVLYGFTGGADGGYPEAGVIRDSAGNLYGTTLQGGTAYAGVVYEVNTSGQETVLYNFTGGADGGYP